MSSFQAPRNCCALPTTADLIAARLALYYSINMATRRQWSDDELLVAFRLYCRTPFGRLHQSNPEIIVLADSIGRTPSAVAMKACNFASLDPEQQARGTAGLGNVSRADRQLWERFLATPGTVMEAAEHAFIRLQEGADRSVVDEVDRHDEASIVETMIEHLGDSEREQVIRTRRVQRFFRDTVFVSYEHRCALSEIAITSLLNASHIIPWKDDEQRRADPRNGLCLNALYDRAFDRGLIAFDDSLQVLVSPELEGEDVPPLQAEHLMGLAGQHLRLPSRFAPDRDAIEWHREHVFRASA